MPFLAAYIIISSIILLYCYLANKLLCLYYTLSEDKLKGREYVLTLR